MNMRRATGIMLLAVGFHVGGGLPADAQCCLEGLFAGCGACFSKPPVYAVAPVMAPVMAPVAAPVPAPPPPVMVPVQQTSYVPETTYRTQYQNVPVTTYKPSCEIDPCTGCPRDCMQPVTQYVQQAVNVPVTQYRAVTTTKYVQMQPGYAAGGYPAGQPAFAAPAAMPAAAPAASPFTAPVQTTPQAWGAAGADIPPQLVPGGAPPALPPQTYQQPITPQGGAAYLPVSPPATVQPQPTQPPTFVPAPSAIPSAAQAPVAAPAPSLKPIPEMPRTGGTTGSMTPVPGTTSAGQIAAPALVPGSSNGYQLPSGTNAFPVPSGTNGLQPSAPAMQGMPVLPGQGPRASTGAFPRLLEPTSHTTSWQPATVDPSATGRRPGYPTAALPARLQQ